MNGDTKLADISSFVFLLILHIPLALSADPLYSVCSYNTNYSSNSTFQANLNLLLSSLTSNIAYSGYFNDTKGKPPDQVFGLAICRGDLTGGTCNDCLVASVQSIIQRCPRQTSATIWYEQCLLRYSNQRFFSQASTSFKLVIRNETSLSEPKRVSVLLRQLMNTVIKKTAYNSSRMFAIENVDFTSSVKLYAVALAQCTRDLSPEDCYGCLGNMVGNISEVGKQSVEALGQSCVAGYELFDRLSPDESTPSVTPASSPPNPTPRKGKSRINKAAAIVIPSVAVILLVSASWLWFGKWRSGSLILKDDTDDHELWRANLFIDLGTLRHATNNFSDANKLGQGGFGQVYKGVLEDGQEIAVKRLSNTSRQGLSELKNEVILVGKLHHKNLVRLFGCCLAEKEKLLVYEYLPNSSLDKFLSGTHAGLSPWTANCYYCKPFSQRLTINIAMCSFNKFVTIVPNYPTKRKQLNWGKRYKIIEGIARGLLYLHRDSRLKIIHRDLKASNILLDADMNPKISDFGLAKLFQNDELQANTRRIAGTYGYMAPEYAMQGQYSANSDVFSYGVLLLEIVTGRMNNSFRGSGRSPNLISYVWQHWREGRALQLKDQCLGDEFQAADVLRCIQLALLCVQEDPEQRPCMANWYLC
ncbi:putative protein kinase RLK-Pelle-DLSV family [Dioscorea sansibarensis]